MDIKDIPGALEQIERRLTGVEGWSSGGIKRLCEVEKQTHILETELLRHSKSIDELASDMIHSLAEVVAGNYNRLEVRIIALEAQIADLQKQKVGEQSHQNTQELLQTVARLDAADTAWAATRKRQMDALRKECSADVDDHRNTERPAPMMACPGDGTESCQQCHFREPHKHDYACLIACRPNKASGSPIRCQPVPAQEPEKPEPEMVRCADAGEDCSHPREGCPHKQAHSRGHNCNRDCARCVPVPEKPAPELVRCSAWETCVVDCGEWPGHLSHRMPHERTEACSLPCHDGTCIPVPASPEVAIPDVPVGTEAFRRELQRHAEELARGYRYLIVHSDVVPAISIESWERLAGVACTLRDAYELARTGEQEQADEKLKEIEW